MSVNVLQRLLRSLMINKSYLTESVPDYWASRPSMNKKDIDAEEGDAPEDSAKRIVGKCYSRALTGKLRKLIVDSGASFHLVGVKSLTNRELKSMRSAANPVSLMSANGVVYADTEVDIFVGELGIKVTAYVLEDTPALLSLGKLVEDFGLEYRWSKNQAPTLKTPGGKVIRCRPLQNVPYIAAGPAGEAPGETLSQRWHRQALDIWKAADERKAARECPGLGKGNT